MSSLERRRIAGQFPGLIHLNIDVGPDDRDDFDDDEIPCCSSSAMRGPRACTCWEPVYDLDQLDIAIENLPIETRTECCHDCAYLNGSPEREAGYLPELSDIAGTPGHVFACHQGMRRVVEWRHPDGRTRPAGDGDYQPPIIGTTAYKADGTPADLCAGWAAHRRGLLA